MESRKWESGPFLAAAFFCEKLLQEADGVKSAIRLVDRLTMQAVGLEPPSAMPPFKYQVVLFLKFTSGAARGPMTLEVTAVKPSGESSPLTKNTVLFEGEDDRGIDVVCNVSIGFKEPGIYWFYVYLDGNHVTRVPFRVIYLPQVTQRAYPGSSTP